MYYNRRSKIVAWICISQSLIHTHIYSIAQYWYVYPTFPFKYMQHKQTHKQTHKQRQCINSKLNILKTIFCISFFVKNESKMIHRQYVPCLHLWDGANIPENRHKNSKEEESHLLVCLFVFLLFEIVVEHEIYSVVICKPFSS